MTSTESDADQTPTVEDEDTDEAASTATDQAGSTSTSSESASGVDLTTRIEQVTEEVRPAVVFIAITQVINQPTGQQNEQQGVGSGVIFDDEGHILTNNHVVENADELQSFCPTDASSMLPFSGERRSRILP
ncbi:MAG: hypothetical protein R2849_10175 [Thermomicrobiales bacterium]